VRGFYYQITYALTHVPDDKAYFHAQWRRSNPLPCKQEHTLIDGVTGQGHYVGTYLAWGARNNGWWGEGEIKFFMDGDKDWPTISVRELKITSAARGILNFPKGSMACSRRHTRAWLR
jgi:hypothetical protein